MKTKGSLPRRNCTADPDAATLAGLGSWRLPSDSKAVEGYFLDEGTVVDGHAAVHERV